LGALIFFSILKGNSEGNLIIDLTYYGFIIVNIVWLVFLSSMYKTRIVIDEKFIYAPYYIWYPNFKIEKDDVFTIKTIRFEDIESIEMQGVFSQPDNKTIPAMKITIRNKYDLCILLDAYNVKEIYEIQDLLETMISKISLSQTKI